MIMIELEHFKSSCDERGEMVSNFKHKIMLLGTSAVDVDVAHVCLNEEMV